VKTCVILTYQPDLGTPFVDVAKTERNPIRAYDAEDIQRKLHGDESACFILGVIQRKSRYTFPDLNGWPPSHRNDRVQGPDPNSVNDTAAKRLVVASIASESPQL
jgi:hypothetical protein